MYLAGEEKGIGHFIISQGSVMDGSLRSGGEAGENPRSREVMVLKSEGWRWEIGEDRGKGGKSERRRHCRERKGIAKNARMGMVKESVHSTKVYGYGGGNKRY